MLAVVVVAAVIWGMSAYRGWRLDEANNRLDACLRAEYGPMEPDGLDLDWDIDPHDACTAENAKVNSLR